MKSKHLISNEVRCNFCFNWFSGPKLCKKGINTCHQCLLKYLNNSTQVHSNQQQPYFFCLYSQKQNLPFNFTSLTKQAVSADINEESKPQKRLKITSLHDESVINCFKSQIFQDKSSNNQREYLADIKNYETPLQKKILAVSKSQFIIDEQAQHNRALKQLNTPEKHKQSKDNFFSLKKIERLQDYGRSLSKSRLQYKYQYHYQKQLLQSFIKQNSKFSHESDRMRQFGDQFRINPFTSAKSKAQRCRTQKSIISNESATSIILKQSQHQIKTKINCFLQSKNTSETLNRIIISYIKQAHDKSTLNNGTLELTGYTLAGTDFQCYLKVFQLESIQTIKLLNVGLTDIEIPILLDFINDKPISTLVLTNNKLTQNCVEYFLMKELPNLRELYLGNNHICKYKIKQQINQLKTKLTLYL